jgi:hypothetical protein
MSYSAEVEVTLRRRMRSVARTASGALIARGEIADLIVLVSAALASAIPFIALACGILPQAVTVQEIFGNNLTAGPAMWYGGYVVQVGHAYLLAFTYLPSALAHTLLAGFGPLILQTGFAALVYLLYGAALFAALIGASRRIGLIGFAGLIAIAVSTTVLERASYYGLVITYHKGTELLFILLAATMMRWLRDDLAPTSRNAAILGALAAAFVGIKVSYIALAGPILLAMATSGPPVGRTTRIASFAMTATVVIGFVYAAFALFCPERFAELVRYVLDCYMTPVLAQSVPLMREEVFSFPSLYLGWHLLLPLWGCAACIAAISAWRGHRRLAIVLATQLIAIIALALQFRVRLSQSTMLDIMIFTTFAIAVLTSAVARTSHAPATALTVLLAATFGLAFGLNHPGDAFQRMRLRSDVARQFDAFRESLGTAVPSVYYAEALYQPVLFPSADLFALFASGPGGSPYLQKFHPRARFVAPTARPGVPHVAIVPEYLDTILADTPAHRAAWPVLYEPIAALGANSSLAQYVKPDRPECRVFQFPAVFDDTRLIYDTSFATRVTVCPMPG